MVRYLIGALSGHRMASRRAECLRTWVADCELLNIPVVFLLGVENIPAPEQFGHALLLPCPDSYDTLSQRTRWFCKWALNRPDWDYLLKCDDDTYVSALHLSEYKPPGRYVGANFGEFCSGGAGYLLSRECAAIIAEKMLDLTGAEDVLVGKLMRSHGIPIVDDHCWIAYGDEATRPTKTNNIITAHRLSSELWRKVSDEVGVRSVFRI